MELSIVICTIFKNNLLFETLDSIKKQSVDQSRIEVLVIDNRIEVADNELEELVMSYKYRYLKEPNFGLTGARHAGLKFSTGKILSYIDDDVILPVDWAVNLLNSFQTEQWQLATGPAYPLFDSHIPKWLKSFIETTPYGGWALPWLSVFDLGIRSGYISPLYVWGLNFSIQKQVLLKYGGFNPDLMPSNFQDYVGDGETGLAKKLINADIKAFYDQNLHVFHKCPQERITLDYFYSRILYSAKGQAFSDFRANNKVSVKSPILSKIVSLLLVPISSILQNIKLLQIMSRFQNGILLIFPFKIIFSYNYHKNLIRLRSDQQLNQWVLKDNYIS
jgi:glycosyltransferase involved in cell wall biosynthesis